MRTVANSRLEHPGAASVAKLLEHFEQDGPNGTHQCLVLELLGPSISNILDARSVSNRLSSELAKTVARQALLGLDYLHQHGIGHGDLHLGNIAFTLALSDHQCEDDLSGIFGTSDMGVVRRLNGEPIVEEPGIPDELVGCPLWPLDASSVSATVKILNCGQSFFDTNPPDTLHTPLAVRAPEIILGDNLDHRVDLWSMGCLLFELFTGQQLFDAIRLTPGILVNQMEAIAADRLPERWTERANRLKELSAESDQVGGERDMAASTDALQEWTDEVFDKGKKAKLSPEDIRKVGELVRKMLWFEPSSRRSTSSLLKEI